MRPTRSSRPSLFVFLPLLSILALLAILAQGCSSGAGPAATPTQETERYVAHIAALNSSGVSGTVELQVTGVTLTVSMGVTGLEPDRRHFQHPWRAWGSRHLPQRCGRQHEWSYHTDGGYDSYRSPRL